MNKNHFNKWQIQSNCRSQSALLAVNKSIGGGNARRKWPKGKDFLFATWAFVIGKISYGEIPRLF